MSGCHAAVRRVDCSKFSDPQPKNSCRQVECLVCVCITEILHVFNQSMSQLYVIDGEINYWRWNQTVSTSVWHKDCSHNFRQLEVHHRWPRVTTHVSSMTASTTCWFLTPELSSADGVFQLLHRPFGTLFRHTCARHWL